jgi:hypothetical protein
MKEPFQMNSNNKQYTLEQFKECAGKGCNNNATKCLEINFLHKHGWFCDSCTKELIINGLAREKSVESIEEAETNTASSGRGKEL